jgi:hypothetical protein
MILFRLETRESELELPLSRRKRQVSVPFFFHLFIPFIHLIFSPALFLLKLVQWFIDMHWNWRRDSIRTCKRSPKWWSPWWRSVIKAVFSTIFLIHFCYSFIITMMFELLPLQSFPISSPLAFCISRRPAQVWIFYTGRHFLFVSLSLLFLQTGKETQFAKELYNFMFPTLLESLQEEEDTEL